MFLGQEPDGKSPFIYLLEDCQIDSRLGENNQ